MKRIYVVGAGGHGAVVAEIAGLTGYDILGFVDDDSQKCDCEVLGYRVIGPKELIPDGSMVVMGIGLNNTRRELFDYGKSHGWIFPVIIHPSAIISPSASIGEGTVVVAQAVVNSQAIIGQGCILNTSCSVGHDCVISDLAHISSGVRLAGGVHVGCETLVGIGSCARPLISIGSGCIIGAGSVVVSDIPDGVTAFGNPARVQPLRGHSQ
ncbi:MAG: acetyltransferase [Armatimonadota bacterium]